MARQIADYLEKEANNDQDDATWLETQRKIYHRQQEIKGLPIDNHAAEEILSVLFNPNN